MQLLKGASSYELFRLIPNFRLRYPKGSLWSAGNFKESIGRNTTETVKQYVFGTIVDTYSLCKSCLTNAHRE